MLFKKLVRLKGLGRYACLGTAVLKELGRKYRFLNVQKGRVDYLLRVAKKPTLACRPDAVIPHLACDYIAPTIQQQAMICPEKRPELIFVDSFSDLTDQLFEHKKLSWQFCSNYQDVSHTDRFVTDFEAKGLLPIQDVKQNYLDMLKYVQERWPGIPIVYLHFPDALETREKFVERAEELRRIVDECAESYPVLQAFSVPREIVRHPEVVEPGMENFPYHYSRETYLAFAEMIRKNKVVGRFF